MTDGTLFDVQDAQFGTRFVYPGKTDTSRAAAEAVAPHAGTQAERVLRFILDRRAYGATDYELGDALGLDGNSLRPRRVSLKEAGLIADSGRTRLNSGGRETIVWVGKDFATDRETASMDAEQRAVS